MIHPPRAASLSPVLADSFIYFSSTLEIMGVVSTMLYFCYMFITSLLFTLATGTVGFLASWWFVLQIYGAVKVD